MGILWEHANSIEWYSGSPAAGALAYFYVGGTTTPLVVFSDAGEGTPITTPVTADANGRWPDVFIPYITAYDVKVTTSAGTQLYYPQLIPNPDPVTVGTSTITNSSPQIFQTGGMQFLIQDSSMTAPTGWVRCNRNSIGNATSGANERANADTANLFTFLWNIQGAGSNTFFPVQSGGTTTTKGATAAADFAASKAILLPDMRGCAPFGVDDMGGGAAGRLSIAPVTYGTGTLGGSLLGDNGSALITANLAAHTHSTGTLTNAGEAAHTHTGVTATESVGHTHSGTTGDDSPGHTHQYGSTGAGGFSGGGAGITAGASNTTGGPDNNHQHNFTTGDVSANHTHNFLTAGGSSHTHAISGATGSTGSGTSFNNLPGALMGTWLIKL